MSTDTLALHRFATSLFMWGWVRHPRFIPKNESVRCRVGTAARRMSRSTHAEAFDAADKLKEPGV